MKDLLQVNSNVAVRAVDPSGRIVDERLSHNILTNTGRQYLRNLVSAASYANVLAGGAIEGGDAYTSARVQYMGFGVGGALGTQAGAFTTQVEVVAITEIEDWVKVNSSDYLKQVDAQTSGAGSFPDSYTVKFSALIPEAEVSFTGNQSKSGVTVNTSVPISEVGLYLSGADKSKDLSQEENTSRLIAYNIFSPVTVTPNIVLRVDWEFRF